MVSTHAVSIQHTHNRKQIEHFVTVMATKLKNELFSNVFAGVVGKFSIKTWEQSESGTRQQAL